MIESRDEDIGHTTDPYYCCREIIEIGDLSLMQID